MFEELKGLIKDDSKNLKHFEEIRSEFNENKVVHDKAVMARARKTAVVLALSSVISVLVFVYAFIVKTKCDQDIVNLNTQIEELNSKLEDCQTV